MFNSIRSRLLVAPPRRRAPPTPHGGVGALFLSLLPRNPSPPPHKSLSSSSAPAAAPRSETLAYLVDSCGLSPESAISAARKLRRLRSTENPDAVLRLLRDYGFGGAHISKIIAKLPNLLCSDPRRILKPKLEFFPRLRLLRRLPGAPPRRPAPPAKAEPGGSPRPLLRLPPHPPPRRGRHRRRVRPQPPRPQFRPQQGDPADHRRPPPARPPRGSHLQAGEDPAGDPHPPAPRRVNEIAEEVEAAGVPTSNPLFVYAFRTVAGLKRANWDRKMAAYKSFGLSEGDVVSAFRRRPMVMKMSEEKIRRVLEFFLGTLRLAPDDIVRHPILLLLLLSLEGRILPRCAVVSLLRRKGKLKENSPVIPALSATASLFLKRYVARYQDEVPEVLKAYNGEIEFKGLGIDRG